MPIVVAALVGGRQLQAPHRRLAIWCCLLVLLEVVDLFIGASTGNNRWTGYLTLPVEVGMTLWILSSWQSPRWERAYLLAVPVIGAAVAIILLVTDPSRTFDVWVSPLLALAVLVHGRGDRVSADSATIVWLFLSAGLGLVVILLALGVALAVYQRRFMAMHRSYADGLLNAQESERAWVAREVHDDALQRIMLIQHELDGWAERPSATGPERDKRLGALRGELEELSTMLRRMAYRLHPVFIEQEGIAALLSRLAPDMDHAGGLHVEIRDRLAPDLRLSAVQSLAVYRIAQESLTNVVKHARSPKAAIEIWGTDRLLEMWIEDFGAGFVTNGAPPRGLGLTSMVERARSAGGMLSVESYPDGGTRVHLRLPVNGAK